jgi:transcriptional regulator
LTDDGVREIRAMRANGASLKDIAKHFNTDRTNVWLIARRKTWRHVD